MFTPESELASMRRALSAALVAEGFDTALADHLGRLAANQLETAIAAERDGRAEWAIQQWNAGDMR